MSVLDNAVPLEEVTTGRLWVIYGKSGAGKTAILRSFPKPMLYIQFGDDGLGTLDGTAGITVIRPKDFAELKQLLVELRKDKKFKTIACDTFSLLVEEWIDENSTKKKKRMSQQMWGDLKTDASELIKEFKNLSKIGRDVVLTCHETKDIIEGLEDEIVPDIRPSLNKGARTYLEALANFGVHVAVIEKEVENEDGTMSSTYVHGVHIAPNPFYWTKIQKSPDIKLPKFIPNFTYNKLMSRLSGERGSKNGKA